MSDRDEELEALRARVKDLESRETLIMAVSVYTYLTLRLVPESIVSDSLRPEFIVRLDKAGERIDEYFALTAEKK